MRYDPLCHSVRPVGTASCSLGRRLRPDHLTPMSGLRTGFDHRPRAAAEAGARRIPRLDRDPAWPLLELREDVHLPAAVFSSLHAFQFAGPLSGVVAALCGALFVGEGVPKLKDRGSGTRCFYDAALVGGVWMVLSRQFRFSARPWSRVAQWLKRGQQDDAQIEPLPWMVSALGVLWPLCVCRKSDFAHHPCLGSVEEWTQTGLRRRKRAVGEGVGTLRRRMPLLDYLEQQHWKGRPAGRWEYVGLCPLHEESQPSFYVNTRKNVFYCHGCGQGGDLIRFVQLSRRLSFRQSLACLDQQTDSASGVLSACWSRLPPSISSELDRYPEAIELSPPARSS